jgi:DNA adenine methylase
VDVNVHLINFYRRLTITKPFKMGMENNAEFYYAQRLLFNTLVGVGGEWSDEAGEIFYYLNRNCFNGVCRFNSLGKFNVPFGKYKTVNFRRDFSEYAPVLRGWEIRWTSFVDLIFESDDFVYADPPYDDTFVDYSLGGFDWNKQVQLAEKLAAHPGPVVSSNKATDRVLALYRDLGFTIETVMAPRRVSSDGNRDASMEMLAMKNIS